MRMASGRAREEALSLLGSLAGLTTDVGLLPSEVEILLGLRPGVWPISLSRQQLWWPSETQAARLRGLAELCHDLIALFGPEVRVWMRRREATTDRSPLHVLLSGPDGLRILGDALRPELGRC